MGGLEGRGVMYVGGVRGEGGHVCGGHVWGLRGVMYVRVSMWEVRGEGGHVWGVRGEGGSYTTAQFAIV